MDKEKDTSKFAQRDSLCWHCSRATDGSCSWSYEFASVEGWMAEKHGSKCRTYRDTWFVKSCPLFSKYPWQGAYDDIGVEKICDAVMARAGMDYLQHLKHEKRLQRRDPALHTKRKVYGDYRNRTKETTKYGKPLSDTWKTLYGFEPLDRSIVSLERFFRSERAEMFAFNINPIYIMTAIQKQVGVKRENV